MKNIGLLLLILGIFNPSYAEIADYLLANGAEEISSDYEYGYEEEYEPSFIGYAGKGNLEKVKECLANGVDVNTHDEDGDPALSVASVKGHFEIVKLLVENGASISAKSFSGNTALMRASQSGSLETVEYLVNKGSNINLQNNDSHTIYANLRKK